MCQKLRERGNDINVIQKREYTEANTCALFFFPSCLLKRSKKKHVRTLKSLSLWKLVKTAHHSAHPRHNESGPEV